jgi:transposase
LEEHRWGYFQPGVAVEKRLEHGDFLWRQDGDTVVYIGESVEDLDEGTGWNYRISGVVHMGV